MALDTGGETFSYDPFTPEVMRDPHPFYRVLRRDHPAYYAPQYDAFFFSRFDDIVEMLSYSDNTFLESEGSLPTPAILRTHNQGAPPVPPAEPYLGANRLGMPVYGEVRAAHVGPIMPRGLGDLEAFIRERAETRLDQLLPTGRFNLTRDYGGFVSAGVMMKLLGLPLERAEEALDAVNEGARTDPESGGFDSQAVAAQAIEMMLPYVEARFAAGADGAVPMVDGLIRYRYNGRSLTPPEVAQSSVCAFIGGVETVPKITAHGLMELANHPGQLAAVRAGLPGSLRSTVEEMIRFCAPAQWFMRTAQKPVTIAGQPIRPGQRAFYLVGSALRDEREFAAPDEFHWDRDIRRTLAFGHGVHFCIGFHLARLEIRIMVEVFLKRVPEFSFDMAAANRPPSSFQWGWNTLPVVIGPKAKLRQ
jgi:cytochrome P450